MEELKKCSSCGVVKLAYNFPFTNDSQKNRNECKQGMSIKLEE